MVEQQNRIECLASGRSDRLAHSRTMRCLLRSDETFSTGKPLAPAGQSSFDGFKYVYFADVEMQP